MPLVQIAKFSAMGDTPNKVVIQNEEERELGADHQLSGFIPPESFEALDASQIKDIFVTFKKGVSAHGRNTDARIQDTDLAEEIKGKKKSSFISSLSRMLFDDRKLGKQRSVFDEIAPFLPSNAASQIDAVRGLLSNMKKFFLFETSSAVAMYFQDISRDGRLDVLSIQSCHRFSEVQTDSNVQRIINEVRLSFISANDESMAEHMIQLINNWKPGSKICLTVHSNFSRVEKTPLLPKTLEILFDEKPVLKPPPESKAEKQTKHRMKRRKSFPDGYKKRKQPEGENNKCQYTPPVCMRLFRCLLIF